jgi:hypothetical protein
MDEFYEFTRMFLNMFFSFIALVFLVRGILWAIVSGMKHADEGGDFWGIFRIWK